MTIECSQSVHSIVLKPLTLSSYQPKWEKSPVKKEDRQKFCFPADDMKARLVAY